MVEAAALLHGEAAMIMRDTLAAMSIDMVYSDPPFGNRQEWIGEAGSFSDNWKTSDTSERGWASLIRHNPPGATMLRAGCADDTDAAYLGVIAGIVLGAHRVLRKTGTLWLHFDDTMGAHLRILCDVVFGIDTALGTIIWRRTGAKSSGRSFGRVHDTIAVYARSRAARWRLHRIGSSELIGGDPCSRHFPVRAGGYIDGTNLNSASRERVGYPTQKPVALLQQLIRAATLPGDAVLDPTCGSGTTLVAAHSLGRRSIGIDISQDAITTARKRLTVVPPPQMDLFGEAA